jgi:hypothetical protein
MLWEKSATDQATQGRLGAKEDEMAKETRKILAIVFILTAAFSWPGISLAADKLLQQSDLIYLGAFRVANDNGRFNYVLQNKQYLF